MPSKYEMISAALREQAKDVVKNTDAYTDFLTTAANNYKYNFREQLLIHLQKPTATACADIDTWNKLGRWVNKGSKGIALIVDNSPYPRLRHVFDVSDTNSRQGREVHIWQMEKQYEDSVITALENSFGAIEKDTDFQMNIIEIAGNVVQDNISDYIEMLDDIDDGSLISFDEDKETELQKLVATSVAYMTMGGSDEYANLVIIHTDVHILLHATNKETIEKYLKIIKPDNKAKVKINILRAMLNNESI